MTLLRSILFSCVMFISIPPYGALVILVRVFGSDASYALARAWVKLIVRCCESICGLTYSVEGWANIPDDANVAMVKHSSTYETLVQLLIFPRQTWVLKRELIWSPFFGWAAATVKPIAINRSARGAAVQQVIDQGKARLAEGIWIVMYPEGTRMAAGETRRYGISGTVLAQEANKLIVPVAHNSADYWPRRGWRKRPGTVKFVIGKPVDPSGRDARQVNEEIQSWVEATVARLRREAGSCA